jgi:hypothetical protein
MHLAALGILHMLGGVFRASQRVGADAPWLRGVEVLHERDGLLMIGRVQLLGIHHR